MAEQSGYSSGKNQDSKSDLNKSSSGGDHVPDPKNIQDLTQYPPHIAAIIQSKRLDKRCRPCFSRCKRNFKSCQIRYLQGSIGEYHRVDYSTNLPSEEIDEMGHRIDDLERNIADLMVQAGVEEADK